MGNFHKSPSQIWKNIYDHAKLAIRTFGGGSLVSDVEYDRVDITYPTSTTEVFVYSLSAVTKATVTVTYLAVDKKDIESVVRT